MLGGLLQTLRPKQWIKNLMVGVAPFFGQKLADPESFVRVVAAFGLFCLISGCIYVINDIVDVEKDRQHPKKCERPIPSGRLPIGVARTFVVVAVPAGLGAAYLLAPMYAAALGAYFVLNLAYCFFTKNIPYLDVASIATGFVLRVLSGALVVDIPASPWLLLCAGLLSLFLGFGKRTHELTNVENPEKKRKVLRYYDADRLRWILHTLALLTSMVYGMYTRSEQALTIFGDAIIFTLPFPIFGILRFIHIVTTRDDAESPTQEMLRDIPFMVNFFAWVAVSGAVIYLA